MRMRFHFGIYIKNRKRLQKLFKKEKVKRPDFMILIPNIGFILTDVKYKEPARKYAQFQIDADETIKYCKMQEKYKLNIWYVFSNAANHFNIPDFAILS